MNIYVYIDESGSIHKNSKAKYFAVGGYFTIQKDKNKIISCYRTINKEIKDEKNIPLEKEIKSFDFEDEEKIRIFESIQKIENFYGFTKVFNKRQMRKSVVQSNIFFNYAVKLVIQDCILPLIDLDNLNEEVRFIFSIDNRNLGVGELKDLRTYLLTEYCTYDFDFQITYYDSATNFGIQLADLIVNTFYNSYKRRDIVKNVLPIISLEKFRVSEFPGDIVKGRTDKVMETGSYMIDTLKSL